MKITSAQTSAFAAIPVDAAKITKLATPQSLPEVIAKKAAPDSVTGFGKSGLPGDVGSYIPGLGKNSPFGGSDYGIPGGMDGSGPGGDLFGDSSMYGFGPTRGPSIKTPGGDRMDGDSGFGIFGKGTWDYDSRGLHGSGQGGATYGGYGVGVNERGQIGAATGDAYGGSVTSAGDAKSGAAAAVGGGSSGGAKGAPEGMDWSRGTRIKDDSSSSSASSGTASSPQSEGPNDLGPTNNDPAAEPEKQDDTAVAQNDTHDDNQAGKPNPDAMPNPEDAGGGSPRSYIDRGAYFMPNPEDGGGGGPRSAGASSLSGLFMPNPEDSGGGTPRSVVANLSMRLR